MNSDKKETEIVEAAGPLRIDVEGVLRKRAPRLHRLLPGFMIRKLERILCQERLNAFLERAHSKGLRGAGFCHEFVYNELGITVDFRGEENLPPASQRRVIYVSNHPLGGLDGMILIDCLQRRHGGRLGFPVNDLLMAVEPLREVFLPVNKLGRQRRGEVAAIDGFFESDNPAVIFPAGLCSRRNSAGVVEDLEWKPTFVSRARKSSRVIIPIHFYGENSSFFYKFAKFRKKVGIKFNIEMIYLPREMFRAEGKRFTVAFGAPISLDEYPATTSAREIAADIRRRVYEI